MRDTSRAVWRDGRLAVASLRGLSQLTLGATLSVTALALLGLGGGANRPLPKDGPIAEWPNHGNDPGGMRYSPLDQINRQNVSRLEVAWVFHTGDLSNGAMNESKTGFESTPIVVDGTMYLSTPFCRVIALDPETGNEKWSYDPKVDVHALYSEGLINRGVSTWLDPNRKPGDACRRRIFLGTIDARLIALDAANGRLCSDFGVAGEIDLKKGVVARASEDYGQGLHVQVYEETSPPAIVNDLVVVGSGIGDNARVDMPSGVVRAFDARTGIPRWSWNPIPATPKDPAYSTWSRGELKTGAANTWAPISVDSGRGLVFLPTSSPSPDYYGGERLGGNLYSDSVVALQASTGKLAWSFQTTHHDLWDYDNPAMPLLCTVRRHGDVDAVIQPTKRGTLFVLNRQTGEPLFPVVERPVPQTDVAGEKTSPTQPFPELPPPLASESLSPDQAFGVTFWDRGQCRKRIESLRNEGIYTPPSIRGSLVIPGNVGGMNWSGAAFDPVRQLLVTNVNNLASEVHLIPRSELSAEIETSRSRGVELEIAPQLGTPYAMSRIFLRSPLGLPCNPPPWSSLVAVDLASGQIRWSVPLGNASEVLPIPFPRLSWGVPSLGGAIVTAGGLVFIAGTLLDPHVRAFDVETGKELWSARLPAPGNATPMSYRLRPDGKQYVVIAAGGHAKVGDRRSDALTAFALP